MGPKMKLGFGLMRLPMLEGGTIDIEQTKQMVDMFMEAGGTYFDTAYTYNNGASEEAAREAIVKRYPRDSFTLATKLNAGAAANAEDARRQIDTSLERTGAGFFDYYLLHSVMMANYEKYDEFDLWSFLAEVKASGKAKNVGFSFHGTPELLEELLDKHEVDFVQIQVNYADWEDLNIASRRNAEILQARGIPFSIMEPVKGGTLANPPRQVADIFDAVNPGASYPSWAIRFAAGLEGVMVVLSGMSNVEQMADNLSYMREFEPLSDKEMDAIRKAQEVLAGIDSIACTGCSYCTKGCPMEIHIPDVFAAMNVKMIFGDDATAGTKYWLATRHGVLASACIQCGQCESVCPQSLPIISLLENCATEFDK